MQLNQYTMARDSIHATGQQPPARDVRAFALLVGFLSIYLLLSKRTSDGFFDSWTTSFSTDPVLSGLTLLCACGGILAAKQLWNARPLSFVTYIAWAILYLAVFLIGDARQQPDTSKLLAGSIPAWIVTVSGAIFVRRRIPAATKQ